MKEFFQTLEDLAFLVGSGVSCKAPTNFPSGGQFLDIILEHYVVSTKRKLIRELSNPFREEISEVRYFLRFEQLIGLIQKYVDPELKMLNCYDTDAPPNSNHLFLACLCRKGIPIFTTNFDCMIEKGMEALGEDPKDMNLIYDKSHWKSAKFMLASLFKLHGTIRDYRDNDRDTKPSLRVTIEQIAREKPEAVLDAQRLKFLKKAIKKRHLIIAGYSGLDDFDVIPSLAQISSRKGIVWFIHEEGSKEIEVLEPIFGKNNNQLEVKCELDHVYKFFYDLVENGTRTSEMLHIVKIDTGYFITQLFERFFPNESIKVTPESIASNITPFTVEEDISSTKKKILTANIFKQLGREEEAFESLDELVRNGPEKILPQIAPLYARLLYLRDGYDKEFRFLQESLSIAKAHRMESEIAFILDMIGRMYEDFKDFPTARAYFKESMQIFKKIREERGISMQHQNLGDVYKTNGSELKAIYHYKKSIGLDKKVGNISHQLGVYNSLGVLFTDLFPSINTYMSDPLAYLFALISRPIGLCYYSRSIKMNEIFGDWQALVILFVNKGILYSSLSFKQKALREFEQALELKAKFANMASLIRQLRDISYFLSQIGIDGSFYLQRALKLLPKLSHRKAEKEYRIIEDLKRENLGKKVIFKKKDLIKFGFDL